MELQEAQEGRLLWPRSFVFCVWVLSHFNHAPLFATPWTVAKQAPLSMRFSRQEYWSGLSSPPPGDLPNPGIEPASSALAGGFFTLLSHRGSPLEGLSEPELGQG